MVDEKVAKSDAIKDHNLREKLKLRKKNPRSCTKIHYFREIIEEKRTSQPLYVVALDYQRLYTPPKPLCRSILFIEITRVTCYEITKLLLTCFPSFAGKEASVQTGLLPLSTSGKLL